jgi:hypothetical protein
LDLWLRKRSPTLLAQVTLGTDPATANKLVALVETCDGMINDCFQFLRRCRTQVTALKAHPHTHERRPQIMRDVICAPQHAVDDQPNLSNGSSPSQAGDRSRRSPATMR